MSNGCYNNGCGNLGAAKNTLFQNSYASNSLTQFQNNSNQSYIFPSTSPSLFGMTDVMYPKGGKGSVVARDLSDIAIDRKYGTSTSLQDAKSKISRANLPTHLKDDIYTNLNTSERVGKIFIDLVETKKGQDLMGYLAKKGGHSDGIQKLLVINEDNSVIAATAPKQGRGFILYNSKAAKSYKTFLRKNNPNLSDYVMDQDFLTHELVHSYLHHPDTDKTQAEMEVEKTLVLYNSKLAKDAKDSNLKSQYLTLSLDHMRRYLNNKKTIAQQNGEKFDSEKAKQELYDEYVADFGDNYNSKHVESELNDAHHNELGGLESIVEGETLGEGSSE